MLSSRFAQLLQVIGASTRFGGSFPLPTKARREPLRVRDPNDPVQAARIQAAQDKRQRKARKLQRDTNTCWLMNEAVFNSGLPVRRLNPLYVNRG